MADSKPAPGPLELVRTFVNTLDLEHGPEQLADPDALVGWLRERDLIEDGARGRPSDLARAIEVREALRSLLLAHNGGEEDPAALDSVREAARRAGLEVVFTEDGSTVQPRAAGVDGALGRLLAIVHDAMRDGTWGRLKACPWDTCHWAFYDTTKNRSGTWCSMDVCGNRAKVRAYRERRAG